jgi:hypothetical protein
VLAQTDDSTFGAIDPALALRPPVPASQSTAALRPRALASQTTAAIAPRAAPELIKPNQGDPLAEYYAKVRQHESGGDDTISNGVAYGRYQFTPQTWLGVAIRHPELGLDKTNIFDPAKQDEAMRALTADNVAVLQKSGLEATPENLFMLHFLGAGGGPKFLRALQADPSANAAALFPLETRYNPTIFHKPDGQPRSLGEVYELMTKTFGGEGRPGSGVSGNLQFAEGPKTVASDAAVDAPPEVRAALGLSTASGGTASIDMPPEIRKALSLPEGGGYQTDASGNLIIPPIGQKPAPSGGAISGLDAFGNPVFEDPKEQREFEQGESTFTKGLLAGAARDVTGPASLLPNALGGQKAQEATNWLNQTGDPLSRGIGGALPFALLAGPEIAALQPSVAGALIGGGSGLTAGTQGSSKETSALGRLNEKLPAMLEEGAAGVALGSLGPAALAGAKWLGSEASGLAKTITGAYGREAEKAAEELRTGASVETGKALSAEDKAKREAILDQRAGERKLATREADYQRADQAAQQIAKEFTARPNVSPEALGQKIHEAAVKDLAEVRAVRERESGFAKAVAADGGAPSVPTRQFIARTVEAERRAVSPEMKSTLSWLKDELRTKQPAGSITAVSTAKARRIIQTLDDRIEKLKGDEKHEMLSLKDDFVENLEKFNPALKEAKRKYAGLSRDLDLYERSGAGKKAVLEDPYSGDNVVDTTKITGALLNRTEGGADVLARLVAKNPEMMNDVRGYFNQQLAEAAGTKGVPSPEEFGRFLNRNRIALERVGASTAKTGSGPLTIAESGGVKVQQVESVYPAYQNYVVTDSFGRELARMSAQRLGNEFHILDINDSVGEEGLIGKSNTMGPRAVRDAAEAIKKLHPEIKRFSGERVTGARNVSGKEDVSASVPFAARESKPPLLKEFGGLKARIEENQQALKSADETRTEMQKSIEQLSKDKTRAETARRDFKEFQSALDTVESRKAPAAASAAIERLHKSGHLTDAQLDGFNRQIREVQDKYKDADEAKNVLRYRVWPAVIGALSAAGVAGGLTEFFSHRVRP